MSLLCITRSEVNRGAKLPTSCSFLDVYQFTGKVHDVGKPFLNALNEVMHQSLLAILCLGVHQLTTRAH